MTITDLDPNPPQAANPFASAKVIGANIPVADYLRQDAKRGDPAYIMSRGELMEFLHCPSRWLKGIQSDETKSTEWGDLIDCLLLSDCATFDKRYAIAPADYPASKMVKGERVLTGERKPWNRNATYCDEWEAANEAQGKTVIRQVEHDRAQTACERLRADEGINEIISDSQKQVLVIGEYRDADTGLVIPCKALLDIVPNPPGSFCNILADLKTCRSAHPMDWRRVVYEMDYHTQGALHMDLFNKANEQAPVQRDTFRHILSENFPPYETASPDLSDDFIIMGRKKYVGALKLYAQCLKENHWPTYNELTPRQLRGQAVTEPEEFMILKQDN